MFFLPDTELDDIVEYLNKTKKAEKSKALHKQLRLQGVQTTVVGQQDLPWYIILLIILSLVIFSVDFKTTRSVN